LDKKYLRNIVLCSSIFLITFISRIIFSEKYFFDSDTVGVAFGSISYSIQNTRPHLPGYFLHVKLISLISPLFQNVHQAMISLSAVYSSLGAVFCSILLKKWLDEKSSILITLLIVFNPLVWYQGSTTESYSFDLLLSALFVLLALNPRTIYLTPLLIAIGIGVRQTSGLLLFPLYIYLWYKKSKTERISIPKLLLSHFAALIICLLWFLPMVNSAGGLNKYFNLYKINSPLSNISTLQNIFQFSSYCFFVFMPIIIALLFSIKKKSKALKILADEKNLILILSVWLIPSLITFIFFNYSKGYFLISIIPIYAFLGILLEKNKIKKTGLYFAIALQILFFVFYPYNPQSLQTLIKPEFRTKNIYYTWVDRTFSSYLMSYSRIKYQDDQLEKLSEIVEDAKAKTIFLDPTIYLAARGMQLKYPALTFVTMDYYRPNSYYEYNGLNITAKKELDTVLLNSLLITRSDFYNAYLKSAVTNVSRKTDYIYLLVEENKKEILLHKYQNLFVR